MNVEFELRRLLKFEPKANQFFRLAIILYELGDLAKNLVYATRFPSYSSAHEKDAKLAAADLITMIHALCIEKGWDFEELRLLGLNRLKERYKEFYERGWREVQ